MSVISLSGMHFYAFHGCFEEERQIGTHFDVDLELDVDVEKACQSDNIEDTVNYLSVYLVVKREMMISSHLLEHVAARISDAVFDEFLAVKKLRIKVAKLNPPLGGSLDAVSVILDRSRSR